MSAPIQFSKKNPKAVISTQFGDIEIRFFTDLAPRHVENFINLGKIGFYNGTLFHRVVPGFVIQGGDPLSKEADRSLHGRGGQDIVSLLNLVIVHIDGGTVSMAKVPRDAGSSRDISDNGSQFFICVDDASSLDRSYSAFGKVIRGMDAVDKIARLACDENNNPFEPVAMKVVVLED